MNVRYSIAGLVVVALCSGGVAATAAPLAAAGASNAPLASRPWANASLTAEQRADALVAQMTLDEKIAMVHGAGYPLPLNAAGYAGVVPGNTRLGIPALFLADSPVGVGNGSIGVTQWPDTANLAATFDTAMANAYGVAYGAEQAGKGHNIALSPTVNILRLPLWGRAPETFSEDPYLTAQSAAAEIKGIQSQHVIATVKHFVANNQEVLRSSINAVVSQRTLQEIYEPAFRTAVQQAGVGAVMCSYNRVNGAYACQNGDTLTNTLRDAWRFDGMVMSDWGALHDTVAAATAGLDLEMPGAADDANLRPIDMIFGSFFNSALKTAVQNGSVPLATLNGMVEHILTAMFRIGLFDHPLADPASVKNSNVSTPAHLALATSLAESGSVLLKNAHDTLPLDSSTVHSIAVIGDAAVHPITAAGGSAVVTPSAPVITPLDGITTRAASAGISVTQSQGTLGLGALMPVPGSAFGAGLQVTYYATKDLSGPPVATGTVPDLNITGNPAPVASLPFWSARYTGTIAAPATGDYRFSLSAGAFVSVRIDGKRVVSFEPMREAVRNGLVHLSAGQHSIRVDVTPFIANLVTVDAFAVTPGLHLGWQPQENLLVEQAATAARNADVAVVVVSDATSEGMDRSTLALPADQDRLVSAVAAANPHTVVVLNTGSAELMPWLHSVGAALEIWYPGQTGGTALGALLFGDVNPSGKLPVTFPASNRQGPARQTDQYPGNGTDVRYDEGLLIGYRWFDATGQKPLFPFGFGLSYTSFRFSDLEVRQPERGGTVTVSVTVKNTGARAGAEVVQLYLGSPAAAKEPPRQLKGYRKVTLAAGGRTEVTFRLTAQDLASWDNAATGWTVHRGQYQVWVGDSSQNTPSHGTFVVRR